MKSPSPRTHTCVRQTLLSKVAALVLLATPMLHTSCATISNGSTTVVSIESDPAGTRVYVDGVPYETPVELVLSNRTPHVVHGPDWKTYEIDPVRSEAAWTSSWLCIIPPIGLPALLIDAATSSNWTLTPNRINVTSGVSTPNPNRKDK